MRPFDFRTNQEKLVQAHPSSQHEGLPSETIRVMTVCRRRLIGELVGQALQTQPGLQLAGSATCASEALQVLASECVDVALVSASLEGDQNAASLTKSLIKNNPGIKVVILGFFDEKEKIIRMLEAGASGYVAPTGSIEELVDTVRTAYQQEARLSSELTAALLARLAEMNRMLEGQPAQGRSLSELTPREKDVLGLIALNMTNGEIAQRLSIQAGTVKCHVHNILKKLGVRSRAEAAGAMDRSGPT
jgi:DNA-binding NarL/FixJ family response regulator